MNRKTPLSLIAVTLILAALTCGCGGEKKADAKADAEMRSALTKPLSIKDLPAEAQAIVNSQNTPRAGTDKKVH